GHRGEPGTAAVGEGRTAGVAAGRQRQDRMARFQRLENRPPGTPGVGEAVEEGHRLTGASPVPRGEGGADLAFLPFLFPATLKVVVVVVVLPTASRAVSVRR